MHGIDYQKAFGSVTHTQIIKSLQLIALNNKISFTTKTMSYCSVSTHLHTEWKETEREDSNTTCNISRRLIITTAILQ